MEFADIIAIILIAAILGGAIAYIVMAKKRGQKCIGCPYSDSCHRGCASCNTHKGKKDE